MPARHKIIAAAEHARLGAFVRKVRVEQNVSQRDLAARLKLPQSFVSKIERGERQLQVLEFIEICVRIGAVPDEVIRRYASGEPGIAATKKALRKKGPK